MGIILSLSLAVLTSSLQEPDPPVVVETRATTTPEIVVTGSSVPDGVPRIPLDWPAGRDVIGPQQISRTGARDLNDLIQSLPALSARPYNGGEAAAPSFSARGLPDDGLTEYLHVAIDGTPAGSAPYGWTAFSFLPLATERVWAVDQIRGGHQVRYSPNTVGGVLNFITRPVPDHPEFEARQVIGSKGYASSFFTGGGPIGDSAWRGSLLQRSGDGIRKNGGFLQRDYSAQFRSRMDDGWLAVTTSRFEDRHQAPGGLTVAEFGADRFGNSRPENFFEGSRDLADVVRRYESGDDAWIEAFASVSLTERHLYARRAKVAGTFFDDWNDTTTSASAGVRAQASVDGPGGEHQWFAGARVHHERLPDYQVNSTPVAGGTTARITDSSFRLSALSLHVDDSFRPTEDILLTAGVRAEWIPKVEGSDTVSSLNYEDEFFALLPAFGASWVIADEWAIFANYGEGFRAPQFWGFAYATDPTDALDFEKGSNLEVGLRRESDDGWSGSVAAWQLNFDDYLVFDTGFYENVGAIKSKGMDLALRYELEDAADFLAGFSLQATATAQDSTLEEGPFRGNEVPYAWGLKSAWRLVYEDSTGWEASLGGTHVGSSYSDEANTAAENAGGNLGRNASWTVWDARIMQDFPLGPQASIQVAVGATNLFDTEWEVHSRGGFFGPGLVAGAPRQSYLSLMFVFDW